MIDLRHYGYLKTNEIPSGLIPGRVTELQRERYTVITEQGEVTAVLKGSFYHSSHTREDFPCVGDFVLLQHNRSGDSRIAKILPRRSKFSRADFSGHAAGYAKTIKEQIVAVNFDYVFIMTSLNRDFRVNRILRYLTQTRRSGGQPVVILTKVDLTDNFLSQVNEVQEAAPEVPVHAISSYTGFGLDALAKYLQPTKTIVLLGMSGVGKSSLLNVLANENLMEVRETRKEDTSKGGHTTTHRHLFMLPSGAMIIDTPGMRELGLIDADESINAGFANIEDLFTQCRFNDCRHESEPGCAVLSALSDGSLSREHWERYLTLKNENNFVNNRRSKC